MLAAHHPPRAPGSMGWMSTRAFMARFAVTPSSAAGQLLRMGIVEAHFRARVDTHGASSAELLDRMQRNSINPSLAAVFYLDDDVELDVAAALTFLDRNGITLADGLKPATDGTTPAPISVNESSRPTSTPAMTTAATARPTCTAFYIARVEDARKTLQNRGIQPNQAELCDELRAMYKAEFGQDRNADSFRPRR